MNKTGTYVKNLSGIASYESFRPTPLQDIKVDLDQEALDLLMKARTSLALLEGYSQAIVELDVFVGSYVQKEALLSSQIEGTQATIEDILDIQSGVSTNLDVIEVVNYVKAMEHAMSIRKDLPLCNRFIKEIHYQLMSSGRGEDKTPGEFRVSQNWVGKAKSNLKTALYIPPNVEDMNHALNDLENFLPSLARSMPWIYTSLNGISSRA